MLKRLMTAVLLVSVLPVLANAAWFFNTQAKSGGGTIDSRNKAGQTVLDGSIFRSYTTSAGIPVKVTASPGFSIRSVTVGTTTYSAPSSPFNVVIPGSYADKNISALFLADTLSVKATNTAGTVAPSSLGNISYGYRLTSPVTFYFTPAKGYEITGVSNVPSDVKVTTSGYNLGVNKAVWVKFDTGYVFTTSLNLTASAANRTPQLTPIPVQTTVPGTLVSFDASGVNIPAGATYTWKYVSGPLNTSQNVYDQFGKLLRVDVLPGPAVPEFATPQTGTHASFVTPSAVGQYKFQLTVSAAGSPDLIGLGTVNVFASSTKLAYNQCQFCHTANGIGPQTPYGPSTVYLNWSASMHKVNGVVCARCHVGADQGGHPGQVTSGRVSETTFTFTQGGGSFCLNGTCHNPGVTHKTVGISCQFCHFSGQGDLHNVNANLAEDMNHNVCFNCHGAVNTTHYFTKVSLANDCLKCHNNAWNPHTETKASFFGAGVVVPPAHFNGYTSYTNPGYAAAYVTATTACSDCHKGGDPNDPVDKNATMKQFRDDWAGSGHGDVKGLPWLNDATHSWKTSGQAGVKVSEAGKATDCQRCHTAKGYAQFTDFSTITPVGSAVVRYSEPLTCNGCHSTDGPNPTFAPRTVTARTGYYNYTSAKTGRLLVSYAYPDTGKSNICLGCHVGRQAGDTIKAIAAATAHQSYSTSFWQNVSFVNSHYLAAGGEVYGVVGYEYPGFTYANAVDHTLVGSGTGGPCVTCHMPGQSHTLSPATGGSFSQCAGCHPVMDSTFLAGRTANFEAGLKALNQALADKGFVYSSTYPYFSNKNWGNKDTAPGTMGAAFNYNMLKRDPGAFAHNPTYVKRLVRDSIDFLVNGSVDRGRDINGTIEALLSNSTEQADAKSFLQNSASGSSACAVCHSATLDPLYDTNIIDTYNQSKHAVKPGGAACGDCHSPTASIAHPPQMTMLKTTTEIAAQCLKCHPVHPWPSQGICMDCHNPHNPGNIKIGYPHFSTYSTAQWYTSKDGTQATGITCQDCHFQTDSKFAVYSANRQYAKSGHGDPKSPAYIGPGPDYTEAALEAFDFKFLGTAGTTAADIATVTNPASAADKDCVRCHTSTGYINYVKPADELDPTTAFQRVAPWGTAGDRTREMVSCPTCHTPTPFSETFSRRVVGTVDPDTGLNVVSTWFNYSSQATKKIVRKKLFVNTATFSELGDSNVCITCHAGRLACDVIKQTTNCSVTPSIVCRVGSTGTFWDNVDFIDPHGGTTVNFMFPDNLHGGYEYRGTGTSLSTFHLNIGADEPPKGPCVGCHMSAPNKHVFGVFSTSNGVIGKVNTDLCNTCHGNNTFPIDANGSQVQTRKEGYFAAAAVIKAMLSAKGIHYNGSKAPYFFTTGVAADQSEATRVTNWNLDATFKGADLMGAAFNLRLLDSDAGYVHNGTYSKRLFYDTIDYLADGIGNNGTTANAQVSNAINASTVDANTKTKAIAYIVPRL